MRGPQIVSVDTSDDLRVCDDPRLRVVLRVEWPEGKGDEARKLLEASVDQAIREMT